MVTLISHALLPRIPGGQNIEEFFRTMCRNFTEGEWSHILAPPTHQQQLAAFYRFWVNSAICIMILVPSLPCHSTALVPHLSVEWSFSAVSEGEFHKGRRQWTELWSPEVGVQPRPHVASVAPRETHTHTLTFLSISPQTCCSGSVLAIDRQRVSDWRFEESLIDKEVSNSFLTSWCIDVSTFLFAALCICGSQRLSW